LVNQHIAVSRRIVPDHLDADAAVRLLGVQKATLYAYVSRGLVRASPGADGRRRLYDRSDLERLRARHDARSGHGPTAAAALRFGEPVLASALTRIDPVEGPLYRGRAATAWAAEGASLERVSEHLWAAAPDPAAWTRALRGAARAGPRYAAALPRHSQVHARMAALLTRAALDDDARLDATPAAELLRGRVLMHLLVHALEPARSSPRSRRAPAPPPRRGAAARLASRTLSALGAAGSAERERAVDAALVLMADHELNASSFAARVAASTGADLYMCLTAALATVSGPEHGSAPDRVEALVDELRSAERVRDVLRARARRGEALPGFGHRLYLGGDPRTPPMLAWAEALAPRSPVVRTLRGLVDAMADAGHAPTCDLGLVALSAALGLPRGSASALFALGRSAGWIAHALEQRGQGFLLRPRARYVGP
jgi:citrate synthase